MSTPFAAASKGSALPRFAALLIALGLWLVPEPCTAQTGPQQSFLVTGNGHGFQIFERKPKDAAQPSTRIASYLEAAYRYARPNVDPKSQGVWSRNLASEFFFGVPGQWLGGVGGSIDATLEYVDNTHIIRAQQEVAGNPVTSYYFAPFDFEANVLIALLEAPAYAFALSYFDFNLGSAFGQLNPAAEGESLRHDAANNALIETGPGGGALVYLPLGAVEHMDCDAVHGKIAGALGDKRDCAGEGITAAIQGALDVDKFTGVAILFSDTNEGAEALASAFRSWQKGRAPKQLLTDARAEFAAWRVPIPAWLTLSDAEKNLWEQSETVLRLGQVRTPNRDGDAASRRTGHGLMLASLQSWQPDEAWMNWHMPWVRDANYAIEPLARMGHVAEARAAVHGFMSAEPVGQKSFYFDDFDQPLSYFAPYRISVTRYFGSGEEESDWGSGPNELLGPEYNVQFDGWGTFLWAARNYVSADLSGAAEWLGASGYNGQSVYELLIDEVGRPLELAMEDQGDGTAVIMRDSSIWEDHNNNRAHFAYTTLSAARGFCDLAAIVAAYKGKADPDYQRFVDNHDKLKAGLVHFQGADASLRTTIENVSSEQYSYDGMVVEAYNFGLIQPTDAAFDATFGVFEKLETPSGGYSRRSGYASREYENNEWVMLDFRIAGAFLKAGQIERAEAIVQRLVTWTRDNYNLFPELIQRDTNQFTGSRPMVGYGAGAFITYLLERELARASLNGGPAPNGERGGNPSLFADGSPRCEEEPVGSAVGGTGGSNGGAAGSGNGATPAESGGAFGVVGSGGGSTAGAPMMSRPGGDPGCACRLSGSASAAPAGALVALFGALGLILQRRRRRRRVTPERAPG